MRDGKINFFDVVRNILRKKKYLFIIVLVTFFSISSHFILHKYVFEKFENTMMMYVLEESKKVGQHIAVHQDINKKNEIMNIAMEHIMEDFQIAKIKLFDKDGYVTYSTQKEDIGTKNKHKYFYENVQKGEIYYKVVNKGEVTLEDETIHKDVAEIYIPILKNGVFIGSSEIYYDISAKKHHLNQLIEQTDNLFIAVITTLQIIVLLMIYIASKSDILKKLHEIQQKKYELELQKQKRTTALGELIGNIAHHWRQPLSLITTAITGLQLRYDLNIFSKEDLEKTTNLIVWQANTLSMTIDRFRDFVQDSQQNKIFFLDEAIQSALQDVENTLISQNIEIKTDLVHISIDGYEKEFQNVIANFLSNSFEAFERNKIQGRKIEIIMKQLEEATLQIFFKDNAGGLEEDTIPKIFDPYFTTKHQFQGTGLGVFFCSKIIREYFNGEIVCTNRDDILGALFTITIPIK